MCSTTSLMRNGIVAKISHLNCEIHNHISSSPSSQLLGVELPLMIIEDTFDLAFCTATQVKMSIANLIISSSVAAECFRRHLTRSLMPRHLAWISVAAECFRRHLTRSLMPRHLAWISVAAECFRRHLTRSLMPRHLAWISVAAECLFSPIRESTILFSCRDTPTHTLFSLLCREQSLYRSPGVKVLGKKI